MIEAKEGSERSLVDINNELEAIVEYCKNNIQGWENVSLSNDTGKNGPAFRYFVLRALEAGVNDCKYFFDAFDITMENINKKEEERLAFIEKQTGVKSAGYMDGLYQTLSSISYDLDTISRQAKGYQNWNFLKKSKKALNEIKKIFKNLDELTPTGYKNDEDYEDYEGMDFDPSELSKHFKGHEFQTVRTATFPERIHWSHVQYDVVGQGSTKLKSLFQAIYAQGMGIADNNNTFIISNAIDNLYNKYKESPIMPAKIDLSDISYEHAVLEVLVKYQKNKPNQQRPITELELHEKLEKIRKEQNAKKERHKNMTPEEIQNEKEELHKIRTKRAIEITKNSIKDDIENIEKEDKNINSILKNKKRNKL